MIDNSRPSGSIIFLYILVFAEFIFFLIAGLLHLGISIPLGFADLTEPRIGPAFLVEEAVAIGFAIALFALFAHTRHAWGAAFGAHLFAFLGVILGMVSLTVGKGRYPRTQSNDLYHYAMLVMILIGLLLLESPAVRNRLKGAIDGNDARKGASFMCEEETGGRAAQGAHDE